MKSYMSDALHYLNHITKDTWKEICDKYKLYSILVFGSIITDEFHDESDIDFAVIGQGVLSLRDKLSLELMLEKQCNREIDVIDLQDPNLDIFVKIQALNNGKTMYTTDEDVMLYQCIEETERYFRINESFYAMRRKELLL